MLLLFGSAGATQAQLNPDKNQLGAWYKYFFQKKFEKSRFGFQGDAQLRVWNAYSDLEQLLLRTGATYTPRNARVTFTLGYANVTTGVPGDDRATSSENRIYQEVLLPQKVGRRFLLSHRARYEQRWLEGQDFRTRYRYNLFVNVPLNDTTLSRKAIYIAFYNEIFINGQRDIGNGRTVEFFDRNRVYLGLGFCIRNNLRVQMAWMRQTTDNWAKNQAQFSLHHSF